MTMIQPLDIQTLFVNIFSGNVYIFVFISLIAIAMLAAKFRMSNLTFGVIICLYATLIASLANWFLFIVVLIAGFAIFYTIGRLIASR